MGTDIYLCAQPPAPPTPQKRFYVTCHSLPSDTSAPFPLRGEERSAKRGGEPGGARKKMKGRGYCGGSGREQEGGVGRIRGDRRGNGRRGGGEALNESFHNEQNMLICAS